MWQEKRIHTKYYFYIFSQINSFYFLTFQAKFKCSKNWRIPRFRPSIKRFSSENFHCLLPNDFGF